jgi:hypothetical protein
VLRVDLIDRVLEKAKLLQQGPNNFVNLCVEGILDAMDAPGAGYDIPILSLYNQVKAQKAPRQAMNTHVAYEFSALPRRPAH